MCAEFVCVCVCNEPKRQPLQIDVLRVPHDMSAPSIMHSIQDMINADILTRWFVASARASFDVFDPLERTHFGCIIDPKI